VVGKTTSEIGVVADGCGSIVIVGILAKCFDASTGKLETGSEATIKAASQSFRRRISTAVVSPGL
jgi:ABC-type transport system involved in Fe-S cluster assembly fused permease/ATPase subunit